MKIYMFFYCFFSTVFFQCSSQKGIVVNQQNNEEELVYIGSEQDSINKRIQIEHKKAWEEATKVRESITDSTFLQTKRPMSDDAIAPYNYKTGFVEDRAYNQVIYIKALERVKSHLSIKKGLLICDLKSGVEMKISEDLFQYIMDLLNNWNLGIKEGKYKIVKTENNGYDVEAIPQ